MIYSATLCFAIFNLLVFIKGQQRFKNILISAFYFLSIVVLVMRMIQYAYVLVLYDEMITHLNDLKNSKHLIHDLKNLQFTDMVATSRHIGSFYQAADYTKFALGFI